MREYDEQMLVENVYQPNGQDWGITPDEFLARYYNEGEDA